MKILTALALALIASSASAQTMVRGYTRSNGTYVDPHVRSSHDSFKSNNYGGSSNSYSSGSYSNTQIDTTPKTYNSYGSPSGSGSLYQPSYGSFGYGNE